MEDQVLVRARQRTGRARRDVRYRRVVAAIAVMVTGALLASCGDDGGDDSAASVDDGYEFPDLSGHTVTFVDYGGPAADAMAEAYTNPFAQGTGAEVLHDAPFDPAQVKAQVDAGRVTWDVVNGDPLTAIAFCRDGLLETLDPSVLDGIDPRYHTGDCVLPVNIYASVLAYDTEAFGDDPPTSWADYFDTERYPGKRGMWSYPALHQLEIALLADGVAPEDLYPLDLDRAFAKLDSIKDDIVFYDTLAQSGEQMHSQTVTMSMVAAQRGQVATREGAPFAPVWNQAILAWEAYGIPKGSQNVEAATALLRYMATPEAQARVAGLLGMGSTAANPADVGDLDDHSILWLPGGDNLDRAVPVDPDWWADHYDEVIERYSAWIAG